MYQSSLCQGTGRSEVLYPFPLHRYDGTEACSGSAIDCLARVRHQPEPTTVPEAHRRMVRARTALRRLRDRGVPDPCDRLLRVTDQNTHDAHTQGFPLLSFQPPAMDATKHQAADKKSAPLSEDPDEITAKKPKAPLWSDESDSRRVRAAIF